MFVEISAIYDYMRFPPIIINKMHYVSVQCDLCKLDKKKTVDFRPRIN